MGNRLLRKGRLDSCIDLALAIANCYTCLGHSPCLFDQRLAEIEEIEGQVSWEYAQQDLII